MPDRQELLSIYLNDHLIGSSAGRDLFGRAAKGQRDTAWGHELAQLAREVDEDRDAQLSLMRLLGISPSRPRVVAGRVAEKLGRLKPNGTVLRRSPLTDLVELESMRVAIAAKIAGWEALLAIADADPRLSRERLENLLARAVNQAQRLQPLHLQAAGAALGAGG